MKCLAIIGMFLTVLVLCNPASAQDEDARVVQLKGWQQGRLKTIEELYEKRRQQEEYLYQEHLDQLWADAVYYARKFENDCHIVWTEFAKLHLDAEFAENYENYLLVRLGDRRLWQHLVDCKLRDYMRKRYYEDRMAYLLLSSKDREKLSEIVNGKILIRRGENNFKIESRKILRAMETLQSRRDVIKSRYEESLEQLLVVE